MQRPRGRKALVILKEWKGSLSGWKVVREKSYEKWLKKLAGTRLTSWALVRNEFYFKNGRPLKVHKQVKDMI